MRRYDASEIEPKWVERWEAEGLYRASEDPADPRPRFYALDMFSYPSGDLHMGHAEAFSGGDAVARFAVMRGHNVLHPIGWDAFGLPARSEEHTSELQSRQYLVCRLLLEKKKKNTQSVYIIQPNMSYS